MFDVSRVTDSPNRAAANAGAFAATPPKERPFNYFGPERRQLPLPSTHWLAATLDEVDYGMLLLTDGTQAVHVNHAAREELDAAHPLHLVGREIRARHSQDAGPLAEALNAARRGLRKLLTLGDGAQRVSVSIVPLAPSQEGVGPATLLMLGKREVCEVLSVQGFARSYSLTGAETRVLAALYRGTPPRDIAVQLGVQISTVRTQIGNIRLKTSAPSIRALVRQVAVLPPLMGVLRGAGGVFGAASNDAALTVA